MKIVDRQKVIIKYLIFAKDYISCQYIAEKIGVSDRTILNDINKINSIFKKKVINIEKGKGIKIADEYAREFLLKEIDKKTNDNEIVLDLIRIILLNNYFNQKIYLEDLCEQLYLSSKVLNIKLQQAKLILKEYQLDIVVSNKKGTYITGNEENIRKCMSNILFLNLEEYQYILNKLKLIDLNTVEDIKKTVLKILDIRKISLTYVAFNSFVMHILIAYIRKGYDDLYESKRNNFLIQSCEMQVVNEIVEELNNKFNLKVEKNNMYLCEHLITSQRFTNDEEIFNDRNTNSLVNKILNTVKDNFDFDFSTDKFFLDSLKMHIYSSLDRYKYNLKVNHINLSEVKNQYPIAYDMGLVSAKIMNKEFNTVLDDTEILFLALHFGTALNKLNRDNIYSGSKVLFVYGSSLSTAQFFKYSLLNNFANEIQTLDVLNIRQYSKEMNENYDLILTNVDNKIMQGCIKVNVIPTENDLILLKHKINNIKNISFLKIFNRHLFFIKNHKNKDEVLEFLTEFLLNKKIIGNEVVSSIFEREKLSNTAIGNMIAIPHPLNYDGDDMKIVIQINKNTIDWQGIDVRLILLILVPKNLIHEWNITFRKIYNVLVNKENLKQLISSKNFDDFYSFLISRMD